VSAGIDTTSILEELIPAVPGALSEKVRAIEALGNTTRVAPGSRIVMPPCSMDTKGLADDA
jgi:hypothetical protein